MVMRLCGWSWLVLISVLACVFTGQRLAETRRENGQLQRAIGLATLEEAALHRELLQERDDRARGLLAPLRRPLTPEFSLMLPQIPPEVRVQEIVITPREWQVTGQQRPVTEQATPSPLTWRLARGEAVRSR